MADGIVVPLTVEARANQGRRGDLAGRPGLRLPPACAAIVPRLPGVGRLQVLARISKEAGFNKYTQNFLNLLVKKDRVNLLDEICESFEEQYCTLTDTQVATLRSAVKLEQEQQFLIAKKLQELTGSKNIKLKPVIDQSLIAGFVVEYGSSQIDLSIRGQVRAAATLCPPNPNTHPHSRSFVRSDAAPHRLWPDTVGYAARDGRARRRAQSRTPFPPTPPPLASGSAGGEGGRAGDQGHDHRQRVSGPARCNGTNNRGRVGRVSASGRQSVGWDAHGGAHCVSGRS